MSRVPLAKAARSSARAAPVGPGVAAPAGRRRRPRGRRGARRRTRSGGRRRCAGGRAPRSPLARASEPRSASSWSATTTSKPAVTGCGRSPSSSSRRAMWATTRPGSTRAGTTWRAHTSRPVPSSGSLLTARSSTSRNASSGGSSPASREQVHAAGRVAQHLHRLEPGDVVEEPAAARVHQHAWRCGLEQRERAHPVAPAPHVRATKSSVRRRSSTTSMYASRAAHGSRSTAPPRVARRPPRRGRAAGRARPAAAPATPGSSRAARRWRSRSPPSSGRRRGRTTTRSRAPRTESDGGCAASQAPIGPVLTCRRRRLDGEGVGHGPLGVAVVVAERLAVGGHHDQPVAGRRLGPRHEGGGRLRPDRRRRCRGSARRRRRRGRSAPAPSGWSQR